MIMDCEQFIKVSFFRKEKDRSYDCLVSYVDKLHPNCMMDVDALNKDTSNTDGLDYIELFRVVLRLCKRLQDTIVIHTESIFTNGADFAERDVIKEISYYIPFYEVSKWDNPLLSQHKGIFQE